MKINIKISIVLFALFAMQFASAQFYVGVQGGVAVISSNITSSKYDTNLGGAIKAGYVYTIAKKFGLGTGIEFAQYRQNVGVVNGQSLTTSLVDQTGSAFFYTVNTNNYLEKQTLQTLQIPLFLQFSKEVNKGVKFNFRAGAKYCLPTSYKINASSDFVNATGFYPDFNLTVTNLPAYGFGRNNSYETEGQYSTRGAVMSFFELGFTFKIANKSGLYFALFLENTHTSIIKNSTDNSFIGYNPNSISNREANGLYSTKTNANIKPRSFGLTVAYSFE